MRKQKKLDSSQLFRLVWGCALLLMGVAFFFRIPEIIRGYSEYDHIFGTWYVMLSLYLVSIMLIGGGGKKVYDLLYRADHGLDASSSVDSDPEP